MQVKVKKLSGIEDLRWANSATTGKPSRMELGAAYKHKHSPIRTQRFRVELIDVPKFVADHLIRHNKGIDHYMDVDHYRLSKRTDRGGADFKAICDDTARKLAELAAMNNSDTVKQISQSLLAMSEEIREWGSKFDRNALTTTSFEANAEALINMAHARLCYGTVSPETRTVVQAICESVEEIDPDLYKYLVPPCIHTGFCRERSDCNYLNSAAGQTARAEYLKLFDKSNQSPQHNVYNED